MCVTMCKWLDSTDVRIENLGSTLGKTVEVGGDMQSIPKKLRRNFRFIKPKQGWGSEFQDSRKANYLPWSCSRGVAHAQLCNVVDPIGGSSCQTTRTLAFRGRGSTSASGLGGLGLICRARYCHLQNRNLFIWELGCQCQSEPGNQYKVLSTAQASSLRLLVILNVGQVDKFGAQGWSRARF